jgi:alpha-tubulin suppressor-like RCC1 family protein
MDGVLEVPELVNVSNVKQIVLGKEHSLVLNENGQVYSWGNHAYGALGAPGLTSPRQKPLRVQSLTNIAMIAAGSQTSYALSSDGRQLWSWGWNNHGQLGIGNKENQGIPTPINLEKILDQDETIVKIDSGFNFASFITSKGRLYTWGNAENFQLGNPSMFDISTPQLKVFSNLVEYEII